MQIVGDVAGEYRSSEGSGAAGWVKEVAKKAQDEKAEDVHVTKKMVTEKKGERAAGKGGGGG